jgi:hypothetical protein
MAMSFDTVPDNQEKKEGGISMKAKVLSWLGCIAILAFVMFTPVLALAQNYDRPSAGLGIILVIELVFALAGYIYVALAVQTIATKTNTPNGWLAWIPIANCFLMLNIAQKPVWWLILLLIPLVNIVVFIIVWMAMAERRGKPGWWGILLIVPVVSIIVPGYLAWAD